MAANGQRDAELCASPQSGRRSHQTPEAFELVRALIYSLRSSCPKSLKERLGLACTSAAKVRNASSVGTQGSAWYANISLIGILLMAEDGFTGEVGGDYQVHRSGR